MRKLYEEWLELVTRAEVRDTLAVGGAVGLLQRFEAWLEEEGWLREGDRAKEENDGPA